MEVQPLRTDLVIYQGQSDRSYSVEDKVSGESLEDSTLSGVGWLCKKRTKNQLVESVFCLSAAVLR